MPADTPSYRLEVRYYHRPYYPDCDELSGNAYVCVQVVPPGVEPLSVLNRSHAKKRGIQLHYIGTGNGKCWGPQSGLGQAIARAEAFIAAHCGPATPADLRRD
jgi:hypothetical protein